MQHATILWVTQHGNESGDRNDFETWRGGDAETQNYLFWLLCQQELKAKSVADPEVESSLDLWKKNGQAGVPLSFTQI